MFSISYRKYRDEEKEKQLVYFDHQNVNSLKLFAPSLRQQLVLVSVHCHAIKNKSKTIQWKKLRHCDVIEDKK